MFNDSVLPYLSQYTRPTVEQYLERLSIEDRSNLMLKAINDITDYTAIQDVNPMVKKQICSIQYAHNRTKCLELIRASDKIKSLSVFTDLHECHYGSYADGWDMYDLGSYEYYVLSLKMRQDAFDICVTRRNCTLYAYSEHGLNNYGHTRDPLAYPCATYKKYVEQAWVLAEHMAQLSELNNE